MRTFRTKPFQKATQKIFSHEQQEQLRTFEKDLIAGEQRGKPLGPYWLREARIQAKRAYYVTQPGGAMFIGASKKKQQQETIDRLRERLDAFRDALRDLLSQ